MGAGKVVATFQPGCSWSHPNNAQHDHSFHGLCFLADWVIQGSGVGNWLAKLMVPLAGNIWGTHFDWLLSVPCHSISFVRPRSCYQSDYWNLNWIGNRKGNIPPKWLCQLYFISTLKTVCDFIPVALGLSEAKSETVEVGVPSGYFIHAFSMVFLRVLVAWIASIGLYQ